MHTRAALDDVALHQRYMADAAAAPVIAGAPVSAQMAN
jgi:hypothetical protein